MDKDTQQIIEDWLKIMRDDTPQTANLIESKDEPVTFEVTLHYDEWDD